MGGRSSLISRNTNPNCRLNLKPEMERMNHTYDRLEEKLHAILQGSDLRLQMTLNWIDACNLKALNPVVAF
jgi:hypothetical protein